MKADHIITWRAPPAARRVAARLGDLVARLMAAPLEAAPHPVRKGLPELPAPTPDGLVADGDPTFGEEFLHIAEAWRTAESYDMRPLPRQRLTVTVPRALAWVKVAGPG